MPDSQEERRHHIPVRKEFPPTQGGPLQTNVADFVQSPKMNGTSFPLKLDAFVTQRQSVVSCRHRLIQHTQDGVCTFVICLNYRFFDKYTNSLKESV